MSEPTPQSSIRRAYGRGYHDAIQKIENERQDSMNPARMEEATKSLSGIAKHVLDATPKMEAWTTQQVCAEIRRAGKNIETSIVMGCLGTLTRQGLVQEKPSGHFIRVMPKQKAPPPLTLQVVQAPTPEGAEQPAAPAAAAPQRDDGTLAKLAELSNALRTAGQTLENFANDLDDVAIEVEERIQKINADSEKLGQLRALLKGIGA